MVNREYGRYPEIALGSPALSRLSEYESMAARFGGEKREKSERQVANESDSLPLLSSLLPLPLLSLV